MSDLPFTEQRETKNTELHPNTRIIGGILFGIIAGILLISVIDRGAYLYYFEQNIDWNDFSWNNWFIRFLGGALATVWGAFIAGLISRRNGKLVGVLSAVPSVLFWIFYLYSQFLGEFNFGFGSFEISTDTTSKIMAVVMALMNIIAGYFGGLYGEEIIEEYKDRFDKKRYSLLGIKWYHYLWSTIPIYFILIQGFFIAYYVIEKILFVFGLPEYSLEAILPNLLGTLGCISIYITYKALVNSYKILSGIDFYNTNKEKVLRLIGYLFGFPILSILIQFGTYYLEIAIYNLLN